MFLPFLGYAQQLCPVISVDPESMLSAEREIEALRADSVLLESAKDGLVREASEHGSLLRKSELTDEKLFALIRSDVNVRTVVLRAINDDCKLRKKQLTPIQPEDLPKTLGSSNTSQTLTLPSRAESPASPQSPAPQRNEPPQTSPPPTNVEPAVPASQSSSSVEPDSSLSVSRTTERNFFKNIVLDQKDIWTSPFRLKAQDAFWLVPSAGIVGGLIHRDVDAFRGFGVSDSHAQTLKTFSDAGVFALGGSMGGLYLLGLMKGNDHARETGILGTEALADSLALSSVLKYTLRRERPLAGDGRGNFFQPGGDSFPSDHAIAAWSLATVLAREYPGPLTKLGAYGLASAISIARVSGRQHFPADVVVGSALGWAIGNQVYKRHHDPDLPGSNIGTFSRDLVEKPEDVRSSLGSPYVPLDSWIYPAMDRLIALGAIQSGFLGLRPWTRFECLRLLEEAASSEAEDTNPEAARLTSELNAEFESDLELAETGNSHIQLDSVYTRATEIAGRPMTDGYHFGQTMYNDYGRPYQQGFNSIAGLSASASHGHWAFYLRAEYQHAPSAPALSQSAVNAITAVDFRATLMPQQFAHPFNEINRVRLLDAYASYTIRDWEISFGNQSLWWGPAEEGSMMLSNNAAPITMLRFSRVRPMSMPWPLRFMGPVRAEIFFGQLEGHEFVQIRPTFTTSVLIGPNLDPQPLITQGKLSFQPTPNLEFGFTIRDIWGGPGFPITLITFLRTFSFRRATVAGLPTDPGNGDTGFDFRYRIPGLRNWLTLYADAIADDELSPIAYPRRSAFRPGIYMPRLPKLPKLDFRAEGVYTDLPNLRGVGNYYSNTHYLSGVTNRGNIIADWIGREGSGFKGASTYWITAENSIQLSYRNVNVNPDFIGGGRYDDIAASATWRVRPQVAVNLATQFERWKFPILDAAQQKNVTTAFTITFSPKGKRGKMD